MTISNNGPTKECRSASCHSRGATNAHDGTKASAFKSISALGATERYYVHPIERVLDTAEDGDHLRFTRVNGQWCWNGVPVEILPHMQCEDCKSWRPLWAPECSSDGCSYVA